MTQTPPEDVEKRTRDFIVKMVQDHWDRTSKVCMLSTLGYELKSNVPESNEILGSGLRSYLRQNYLVQVVQFPNIPQKVGAIPLSVTEPDDPRPLFTSPDKSNSTKRTPLYEQGFWDSFIRELGEGKVRVVSNAPDGTLVVEDIEKRDLVERDGEYLITPEDITSNVNGKTNSEKAEATSQKIEQWLKAKGIDDLKPFIRNPKQFNQPIANDRLRHLVDAFDGLSDSDLSRISIPLDIISKLIRSK